MDKERNPDREVDQRVYTFFIWRVRGCCGGFHVYLRTSVLVTVFDVFDGFERELCFDNVSWGVGFIFPLFVLSFLVDYIFSIEH